MLKNNSVCDIINNYLCTGCGACEKLCPSDAIEMKRNPAGFLLSCVDLKKCINCGKCLMGCPSEARQLSDFIGSGQGFIGFAENTKIRLKGQSGGVVTALLIYLLENNLIDGAIVSRLNPKSGLPEAVCLKTADEIMQASGSVYAQTSVIKTVLENQHLRTAVVVLGCQSESLKKIKQNFPNIKLPEYIIGLICGGNMSLSMMDTVIKKSRSSNADRASFKYRDTENTEWPGDITLKSDGKINIIPKEWRMQLKPVYECYRCVLCADKMNLSCDLVVGDPWGIEPEDAKSGYSVIISYTDKGLCLINNAKESLNLKKSNSYDIVKGQKIDSQFINKVASAFYVSKENGYKFPYDNDEFAKPDEEKLKEMQKRLIYTRKYYSASDIKSAKKIASKKIRSVTQPLKNRIYNIKKKIFN